MPLPTAKDESENKVLSDIQNYGLHIINVLEEGDEPNFTYSVGLWHSYKQPEVIIYGLKDELAKWTLNEIGRRIREDKESFSAGDIRDGFLEGFTCNFIDVPKSQYRDHVGWNCWLYESKDFPLLQLVWPDTDGVFPWDAEASQWFRTWQPILKGH